MDNNNNNANKKPNKVNMPKFNLNWLYMIIAMMLLGLYITNENSTGIKSVSYDEFQQYVRDGYMSKIIGYDDNSVEAYIKPQYVKNVFQADSSKVGKNPMITTEAPSRESLGNFLQKEKDELHFDGSINYEKKRNYFGVVLWQILPIAFLIGFWIFMSRRLSGGGGAGGGGIFNVGKSRAQLFEKGTPVKVTFKDVAGLAEAKQEVEEIVEFLKEPQKYTDLGGKIPKGALLVGPPGTGKTLLAKAVAGEANVPFFSLAGSDFVEMFVGVGASRVRDLFRQAKEKAPCIVFIDEIDAVGRARAKAAAMGGNDERENTLNQLLTEMDGFGSNSGVIILAATNRVDVLDKALLRAGRFDRQIHVDLPDLNERKEVFGVHLRPIKIDNTVDVDLLARQTPGFSGADIANVCNEAALIAARHGKKFVGKQDFLDAVDRIVGGLEKKTKITTEAERRSIAIHEAGHASISWLLEYANPLIKVTIVPRGRALGAAWYLPEERQITTKEQMLDEMCATLGGRAAEDLFLGRISTGAMNDLERVTKQAFGMIAYLGMSEKLPNLCYYSNDEYSFNRPYSEKTAELIDEEVKNMVNEQYERAKKILSDHKDGHAKLSQLLIDREVIFAEDVEEIFGKRPWASRSEEISANKISEDLKKAEEAAAKEAVESEKEVKAEEENNVEGAITGVLFVVVLVGCILYSPLSFGILFTIIGALSVHEFAHLINQNGEVQINKTITALGGAYLFLAVMGFCQSTIGAQVFLPYLALLLYLIITELYLKKKNPIGNWAFSMLSQLYVALPFALLNVLAFQYNPTESSVTYNPILPLSIFVFIWLSDTGAYCVGSLIGKHRLFERISPKKSWEGSIGGGVFSIASSFVFAHYFSFLSVWEWAGLALVVVIFGTWGDLTESLMKRQLGIKDSGHILPGHGGMLDRFDSALLAIPAAVVYLYVLMLMK